MDLLIVPGNLPQEPLDPLLDGWVDKLDKLKYRWLHYHIL